MPVVQQNEEKKRNPRGVFERPPGSGVWWINYYDKGRQHREKIGRKSDAIEAYMDRKTSIRRGEKLPTLRRTAPVMISDLIDLMLEHVKNQKHKDLRTYESRGEIVRKKIGKRDAETFMPADLEDWLSKHCKTPATFNRYKALISLAYKRGIFEKKVTHNPARDVQQRKEPHGRLRFLSRKEYETLQKVILKRFPDHLAEFVVATHTGMRQSEQYTVEWGQYDSARRTIDLETTKNGDARTVHLNADAIAAIESLRRKGHKRTDRIFPREDRRNIYAYRKQERFDCRSWFDPAVTEAGIPRITWHGLRHTFCSWLAMAGATTIEIMEAAGHKTMSQAKRYAHLSPEHKLSVVERIAGATVRESNMHHNRHQRLEARKTKNSAKKKAVANN